MEMSVQFYAPAALFQEKTRVIPITFEAGWAQVGEGAYWKREVFFPQPEIEPRFFGRPYRSLVTIMIELPRIHSPEVDGFGGLVVGILANGTRVRGFKPGRSRWSFRASGKSSVCLLSEGK